MDYPKLISEKWNLTAKFNRLQAIYFDAPSALAVPMCEGQLVHLALGLGHKNKSLVSCRQLNFAVKFHFSEISFG